MPYPLWERIVRERAIQGLTWTELTARTKLPDSTIRNLRTSSRVPQPRIVNALADALGIDRIEAAVLAGLIPAPRKAPTSAGRAA